MAIISIPYVVTGRAEAMETVRLRLMGISRVLFALIFPLVDFPFLVKNYETGILLHFR